MSVFDFRTKWLMRFSAVPLCCCMKCVTCSDLSSQQASQLSKGSWSTYIDVNVHTHHTLTHMQFHSTFSDIPRTHNEALQLPDCFHFFRHLVLLIHSYLSSASFHHSALFSALLPILPPPLFLSFLSSFASVISSLSPWVIAVPV